MARHLLTFLILVVGSNSFAAYPYDSVSEVVVPNARFIPGVGHIKANAGSATLIAVSTDQALLLSCKHVAIEAGKEVRVYWPATGEKSVGEVLLVGEHQDIAMCICPRPKGLRPIPIRAPRVGSTITNAGYPGAHSILEWQRGRVSSIGKSRMQYSCKPRPGMSGGATFDEYGNQVGVIIEYWPWGGVSASGPDMLKFVGRFIKSQTEVQWKVPDCQTEVKLTPAPPEMEIKEVELVEILDVPQITPPAIPPAIKTPTRPIVEDTRSTRRPPTMQKPKKRRPKRRPLFRRRV